MTAAALGRSGDVPAVVALVAAPFFLFALFPYVAILPLPTDTQPNALLFAALIWLAAGARTPLPLAVWSLLGLFLLSLMLVNPASFAAWRSCLGYASLFLTAAAVIALAGRGVHLSDRALATAVHVWFIVGLVQLTLDREFLGWMVSDLRTTADRGVTGLATEPSHYATVAMFLLLLLHLRGRELSFAGLSCILQVIVLAQSAQIALVLALALVAYGLLVRPAALIGSVLAAGWAVAALEPAFVLEGEGSRILRLAGLMIENPALLVLADASGSQRFASMLLSFKGMLDNHFLPGGLDGFSTYMAEQVRAMRWLFWFAPPTDRISSGYGTAAYELGLFGLGLPLVIALGLRRYGQAAGRRRGLAAQVGVHALMITAVPLALPLVGLLIGSLYAPPRSSASVSA